ncbi:MAG: hypothetical protein VYA21_03275, partial [Verrucomicrobiota bacterium]|nr:hypothetical protein [Verrucomicrobiota bacterium]
LLTVGALAFSLGLKVAAPAMDGIDWKKIPMAMVGLAVAAFAAVGLSVAGALIVPAVAGTALLGLLSGALMIGVGGLAFALALIVANGALNSVDMKSTAMNMGALLLVVLASIPLAVSALLLGAVALPAIGGLLAGALMVGVGALAFTAALWVVSKTLGKLDMPKITTDFLLLNVVTAAAIPFALSALVLGPLAVGAGIASLFGATFLGVGGVAFAGALLLISKVMDKVDMVKATAGFLLLNIVTAAAIPFALTAMILGPLAVGAGIASLFGATFLGVGGVAFAGALALIAVAMDQIDMAKAAAGFLALALVVGVTIPFAIAALALGPVAVPATIGALGGAIFLGVAGLAFTKALSVIASEMDKIDMKKAAVGFAALALVVLAAFPMAYAVAAMAIPAVVALIGLYPVSAFMEALSEKLSDPIKNFASMKIEGEKASTNAKALSLVMEAIADAAMVSIGLAVFSMPWFSSI